MRDLSGVSNDMEEGGRQAGPQVRHTLVEQARLIVLPAGVHAGQLEHSHDNMTHEWRISTVTRNKKNSCDITTGLNL